MRRPNLRWGGGFKDLSLLNLNLTKNSKFLESKGRGRGRRWEVFYWWFFTIFLSKESVLCITNASTYMRFWSRWEWCSAQSEALSCTGCASVCAEIPANAKHSKFSICRWNWNIHLKNNFGKSLFWIWSFCFAINQFCENLKKKFSKWWLTHACIFVTKYRWRLPYVC